MYKEGERGLRYIIPAGSREGLELDSALNIVLTS